MAGCCEEVCLGAGGSFGGLLGDREGERAIIDQRLQVMTVSFQLGFVALALVDVDHDAVPEHAAIGLTQRDGAQFDPARGRVRKAGAGFDTERRHRPRRLGHGGNEVGRVIRMHQSKHRRHVVLHILGLQSEDFLNAGADEGEAAVSVGRPPEGKGETGQIGDEFRHPPLGIADGGDVAGDSEHGRHLAILVRFRHQQHLIVPLPTVAVGRDSVNTTGFAAGEHPADACRQPGRIAGAKQLAVARHRADQGFDWVSAHHAARRIGVESAAITVVAKNGVGAVLGQAAELPLAAADFEFHALALGDVAADGNRA